MIKITKGDVLESKVDVTKLPKDVNVIRFYNSY